MCSPSRAMAMPALKKAGQSILPNVTTPPVTSGSERSRYAKNFLSPSKFPASRLQLARHLTIFTQLRDLILPSKPSIRLENVRSALCSASACLCLEPQRTLVPPPVPSTTYNRPTHRQTLYNRESWSEQLLTAEPDPVRRLRSQD